MTTAFSKIEQPQNWQYVKRIVSIGVIDPAESRPYSCAYSFTVILALSVKILNTISKLEVKLSTKYLTASLNMFQVSQYLL